MRLTIALFLILPFLSRAQQKIDPDSLTFEYTGVEKVDSVSAKALQSRAKLFVAQNFKSAKDVTQLDDQDAGVILVKGTIRPIIKVPLAGHMGYGYVHFTIKLQFKDGRYKYTYSEFRHESFEPNQGSGGDLTGKKPACGTFLMSKNYWHQIKTYTNDDVTALISTMKSEMQTGEITAKKDDNF